MSDPVLLPYDVARCYGVMCSVRRVCKRYLAPPRRQPPWQVFIAPDITGAECESVLWVDSEGKSEEK